MKGLLISGMKKTAMGMAQNLASMVERFGFVPNGGRIYYKRSQPPMLTPIVYAIYEETNNSTFVKELLPMLEKEFQFWENNRESQFDIRPLKVYVFRQVQGSFSGRQCARNLLL